MGGIPIIVSYCSFPIVFSYCFSCCFFCCFFLLFFPIVFPIIVSYWFSHCFSYCFFFLLFSHFVFHFTTKRNYIFLVYLESPRWRRETFLLRALKTIFVYLNSPCRRHEKCL